MLQKAIKFFLLCFVPVLVHAGTVRLVNDSIFKLRAVIRAADGTYLGEVIINPLQTMSWNDYWGGIGYYNQSRTPYTVIWYCLDGGDFSICTGVSTGSTVTCNSCDGTRSCKPKAPPEKPLPKGPPVEEHLQQQEQEQEEQAAGPPQGMLQ